MLFVGSAPPTGMDLDEKAAEPAAQPAEKMDEEPEEEEEEEAPRRYTITKMKELCRENGLDDDGNRSELMERLRQIGIVS